MRTIVIAPHPDDETLGVGGTLLRRKFEGAATGWLIVTSISSEYGYAAKKVDQRAEEITNVSNLYDFDAVFELQFPTTRLDQVPVGDLVDGIASVFKTFQPNEVFLPHPGDVHTDHGAVFNAAVACTKWFRYPSVNRVLIYETLSETDFSMGTAKEFRPNVFVDIEPYLESKLTAMSLYSSELGEFPFPRSLKAMRALAALRGAASGFKAAEAFELLRERY